MAKLDFIKLNTGILNSSIMDEKVHVRWAWASLLCMADWDGYVQGTPGALARMANLPDEQMSEALNVFLAPDENSTSGAEGGRRLLDMGGNKWLIVNFVKYRTATQDEIIKQNARKSKAKARRTEAGMDWDERVFYIIDCKKYKLPVPEQYRNVSDIPQTSTHKDKDKDIDIPF